VLPFTAFFLPPFRLFLTFSSPSTSEDKPISSPSPPSLHHAASSFLPSLAGTRTAMSGAVFRFQLNVRGRNIPLEFLEEFPSFKVLVALRQEANSSAFSPGDAYYFKVRYQLFHTSQQLPHIGPLQQFVVIDGVGSRTITVHSQQDLRPPELSLFLAREFSSRILYAFRTPDALPYSVDLKLAAGPTSYIFSFPSTNPPTLAALASAYTSRFQNAMVPTPLERVYLVEENGQFLALTNEAEWEMYGWAKAVEVYNEGRKDGRWTAASFNLVSPRYVFLSCSVHREAPRLPSPSPTARHRLLTSLARSSLKKDLEVMQVLFVSSFLFFFFSTFGAELPSTTEATVEPSEHRRKTVKTGASSLDEQKNRKKHQYRAFPRFTSVLLPPLALSTLV
jgi:hypothetical protein